LRAAEQTKLIDAAAGALQAEVELAVAHAQASDAAALIAQQKSQIAMLRRELYGPRSEPTERLIDLACCRFRRH